MANEAIPVRVLDGFDFSELDSSDFKEDSVREEIIKPILNALGYSASGKHKIQRSKRLRHPFVKTASGKRQINIFPDYLLKTGNRYVWVLDAKDPKFWDGGLSVIAGMIDELEETG